MIHYFADGLRLLLRAVGINYAPLDESWLSDCMWAGMSAEDKEEFNRNSGHSKEPQVNPLGY